MPHFSQARIRAKWDAGILGGIGGSGLPGVSALACRTGAGGEAVKTRGFRSAGSAEERGSETESWVSCRFGLNSASAAVTGRQKSAIRCPSNLVPAAAKVTLLHCGRSGG